MLTMNEGKLYTLLKFHDFRNFMLYLVVLAVVINNVLHLMLAACYLEIVVCYFEIAACYFVFFSSIFKAHYRFFINFYY